jgi:ribosomal protein S18 acetylase RimI-like enzyme
MNINQIIKNKLLNRIKQFGILVASKQIIFAIFRPILEVSREVVLVIPDKNHRMNRLKYPDIYEVDKSILEELERRNELTENQAIRFNKFLSENCKGFISKYNNVLSGYVFLQMGGVYTYGRSKGRYKIPDNTLIVKNLFVDPEFRGKSIARKLISTSINNLSEDLIPTTFVLVENKPALKNFKSVGFEEVLILYLITWFGKWTKIRIVKTINKSNITDKIVFGLKS